VADHAPSDKAFILGDKELIVQNMTDEHAMTDGGLSKAEQAVLDEIDERNVDFLRLQFTDILGVVKNVSVPAHQAEKAFTEGIYFDGSSIEGFVRIQESDMRLVPDPETFVRGAPVAQRRGRLRRRPADL